MTEAPKQLAIFRWLWFVSLAGGISFAAVALAPQAQTDQAADTRAHARLLARSLARASVKDQKANAANAQTWIDSTRKQLQQRAPFGAMVLVERQKGMFAFMRETSFLAHSDPKRRGKALQKKSARDKALFDLTQGLSKESQKSPNIVKISDRTKETSKKKTSRIGYVMAAAPLLTSTGKHIGNAIVTVPTLRPALHKRRSPLAAYAIGWLLAIAIVGGLLLLIRGPWGHLVVLLGLMGCSLYPFVESVERQQQRRIHRYVQQKTLLQDVMHHMPTPSQAWLDASQPHLTPGLLTLKPGTKKPVILLARAKLQAQPSQTSTRPYVGLGMIALLLYALYAYGFAGSLLHTFLQHRAAYLYTLPAMGGMLLLVFLPFAVGIVLSLFQHTGGGNYTYVGLKHFQEIMASSLHPFPSPLSFYFTLTVTILWTVLNVFLHVSIGLSLALMLKNPLLRMKEVYRVLLILPWAIPNYITALIWKGMFHQQFGAINAFRDTLGMTKVHWFSEFSTAFTANLVTNTWLGFPFMMVVSLGALQSIPGDLYEAADVDGANAWQKFVHITLPLLKPALFPAIILGSIWTFNMFNVIYLVSGGGPNNSTDILLTEAYHWAFTRGNHYGYAAAYSVIIFIILLGYSMATNRITKASEGVFQD